MVYVISLNKVEGIRKRHDLERSLSKREKNLPISEKLGGVAHQATGAMHWAGTTCQRSFSI